MPMYVSGGGSMGQALIHACVEGGVSAKSWFESCAVPEHPSTLVHVGSNEKLAGVLLWCEKAKVPLIQGATGQNELIPQTHNFPVIIAPNFALPFVVLFSKISPGFRALADLGMNVKIVEEHQASKKTASATAATLMNEIGIPRKRLSSKRAGDHRHAIHKIVFEDYGKDLVFTFETRVQGLRPYALGAIEIARRVEAKREQLENRVYSVQEILDL